MLNRIILMGRLVADPELQHTPSDIAVSRFRIACERSFAKQGEDKKTDFIDVTVWRNTADFVCRYFTKGRMIAVEGALRVENYTDRDGNKRTKSFVEASDVYFADSNKDSSPAPAPKPKHSDRELDIERPDDGSDDFSVVEDDGDLPF